MKILLLPLLFSHPDKGTNLYTELVMEFVAQGHEVYVATILEAREGKETFIEDVRGAKVLYVRCGDLFGVNIPRKALTMLSLGPRFVAAIREHFRSVSFDLVVYPTPPITFAPVVARLKASLGCHTYLILRDIFPQNARDLGMIRDPLTYWFFRRKEQHLYDLSDHIGCMSQGNIDYVLKHNRVAPAKLEILYNWEAFRPDAPPDPTIKERYGLQGKFVAVFGGNIGFAQELEFSLELAKLYRHRPDIVFLIAGKGVAKPRISEIVEREKLANVVLRDYIPREDFDELLRACDVGLINLDRRFTIPNIPSKTTSYFAAGLPVLASIDAATDYGRLLEECGGGLWSLTGDLAAYHRNFERLLNDRQLRRQMGQNGRRAFMEKFTVERAYRTIMRHFT